MHKNTQTTRRAGSFFMNQKTLVDKNKMSAYVIFT